MSFPDSDIIIKKDGSKVELESLEHSERCFKLRDLAKKLGKVTEDKDKDHVPAYQETHINN
jgi:hypothetical protein